jgi:menaquinone-dependent protoporphyrinogen oxidase
MTDVVPGSTAGIAEQIARKIVAVTRYEVVCRPVDEVDLAGVDALVLGSAVHDMAWLPATADVLRQVAAAGVPVWCFSVGSVQPRVRLTRLTAREEARRVQEGFPPGVLVRDHQVVRGVVDMRGVPWWVRPFHRTVSGPPGDHRGWAAVDRWAARLAPEPEQVGRPRVSCD